MNEQAIGATLPLRELRNHDTPPTGGLRPPSPTDAEPIPEEAWAEIRALLESGDLFRYTAADGDTTPASRLERDFAAFIGSRFALSVNSCSSALFLALRCLDLPRGAPVLIPAFTFAAVPSAVVHAGLRPVLVECGDDLRMDMADFAAKLAEAVAEGPAAVLVSHMRGHTSDMDTILELAAAAEVPVIEDAAHSLGTLWRGRRIGTLGKIGCFSFQSYKMVNGGEGGMLVTDDADIIARAIIMSGAYEHNWKKHPAVSAAFTRYQNRLPLYNMRMNNLSAAVIRPQIAHIERRVAQGRRNHDRIAGRLARHPNIIVPAPLPHEERAPDSFQFLLEGLDENAIGRFVAEAGRRGVKVSIFGRDIDNARAFWNWHFIGEIPDLPCTRAMLMRAADVRLPVHFSPEAVDATAAALEEALAAAL